MAKTEVKYICSSCGSQFSRWQGKCDQCGQWNSLVETVVSAKKQSSLRQSSGRQGRIESQSLNKVTSDNFQRTLTGTLEFDRVLGGGIVPGEVILVGGEPGIGKSTLLLQIASKLADEKHAVLYVSGEESLQQIKMRADRISKGDSSLQIMTETNVEGIADTIDVQKPSLVIIDSIQTLYSDEIASIAGGIAQVQLCGQKILEVAKKNNIPVFLVGHVTKEGTIAGPRVLEHMVDVVLYLEGERFHTYRLLHGVKNRFGPTDEVGVFEMTEKGMIEVKNPSEVLLKERLEGAPGSVITATMEGTRPLLVEIQALTSRSVFGYPKRTAAGIDFNRLQLLVAVLTKRLKIALDKDDVYVNIVGGFKINEPACDLGISLAVTSAFKNKPLDPFLAVFGEVGLSGELRSVKDADKRIKEVEKLGFKKIILPQSNRQFSASKAKLLTVRTLKDAMEAADL